MMQGEFQQFWFVWCEGGGTPNFRHETLESATKEAERLALAHPGMTFTVLVAVCQCRKATVEWKHATDDYAGCDIPF